jgi:serine/threonine protein kinase
VYALKRVRVQPGDQRALESFANEITLLTRLKGHPCIIQLVDWAVDRRTGLVLMLMELGETDLNRLLQQQQQQQEAEGGGAGRLSPNFVRYVWEQMLRAVHCVHEVRAPHPLAYMHGPRGASCLSPPPANGPAL